MPLPAVAIALHGGSKMSVETKLDKRRCPWARVACYAASKEQTTGLFHKGRRTQGHDKGRQQQMNEVAYTIVQVIGRRGKRRATRTRRQRKEASSTRHGRGRKTLKEDKDCLGGRLAWLWSFTRSCDCSTRSPLLSSLSLRTGRFLIFFLGPCRRRVAFATLAIPNRVQREQQTI